MLFQIVSMVFAPVLLFCELETHPLLIGSPFCEVIEGVTYEWKNSLDEEAFKRVSVEAVYQCYKDIPEEELLSGSFKIDESMGLKGSLEKWTDDYIQELSKNLEQSDCSLQIVTAWKEAIPVGFAIFEMKAYPASVYLSELIVDPNSQRNGIGKNLVFSVLGRFPELEKIVLVTRKANFQATAFYPAIGFVGSDYIHLGYDPEIYKSFEFINSKKGSYYSASQTGDSGGVTN